MMGAVGAAVILVFFTATTVRGSTDVYQCNNPAMNLAWKVVADWERAGADPPPHPAQQSGSNQDSAKNAVDCEGLQESITLHGLTDSTDIVCSTAESVDDKIYAIWTLDLESERFIGQIDVTSTENNQQRNKGMVVCVVPGTDDNDWTEPSSITDATLENLLLQGYCLTKSLNEWVPAYTESFEFFSSGQYVVIFAKNKLELCEVEVIPGLNIEATCGDETFHKTSALSGYFTSPGFPNAYDHNQACSWHFTAPTTMVLYFEIIEFELETVHDTLRLYEGEDVDPTLEWSGTTALECFLSEFPSVRWDFDSDGSVARPGFKITYRAHTISDAQELQLLCSNQNPVEVPLE